MSVKIVRCPKCRRVFMAAAMPDAEIDREIAKEFRGYARLGFEIDIVVGPVKLGKPCAHCIGPAELFDDGVSMPLFREARP